MTTKKKRRYPSGRLKLHAMKDRLEQEIAERQEMLEEVTRLTREADNTAIVQTATNYNVTPEAFELLVQALNSGKLDTETLNAALAAETPYEVEEKPDENDETPSEEESVWREEAEDERQ